MRVLRAGGSFTDADFAAGAPFRYGCVCVLAGLALPHRDFGPGEPEMAHKTDEYCRVDKLEEACESYIRILEKWCLDKN